MDEIAPLPPADDVVFLESLDKHDGLIARHRFDRLPVTLGAAYDSDHIVDAEPSKGRPVAARIMRSADGSLEVTASDGAPDFWAPGGMTRAWRIDPDQSFLLGGQRFRVRTRGYVASARSSAAVLPALGRWAVVWALPLALACGAVITWLGDIDGQGASAYVSGALFTVGMLAVWSGAWAALSRLTGRASHFLAHLSLAALAVVAVIVLDYTFDSAAFAFNLPTIQRYDYALLGIIVGVLVWCRATRDPLAGPCSTRVSVCRRWRAVCVSGALSVQRTRQHCEHGHADRTASPSVAGGERGVDRGVFCGCRIVESENRGVACRETRGLRSRG